MSRETDSSSSGPQGRGGAAYPSGTPPYGPPGGDRGRGGDRTPQGAPWQQGAEPEAEEPPAEESPETQTTLTTRIRINIPGSRPIPPVVMRTPVGEGDNAEAGGPSSPIGGRKSPGTSGGSGPSGAPAGAPSGGSATGSQGAPRSAPAPAADAPAEKTSDWFAPRKPAQPTGGSAGGPGGALGGPGGAPGSAGAAGGAPAPSAPSAPPPSAPGGPSAGGTRGDLPYFSESGEGPGRGPGGPGGHGAPGGPGGSGGQARPGGPSGGPGGRGPGGGGGGAPGPGGAPGIGGAPGDQGTDNPLARSSLFGPGPGGSTAPGRPGPSGPAGPSGPTGGPATGDGPVLPAAFQKSAGAGNGISAGPSGPAAPAAADDTAVLTPQSGDGPPPGGRHVSGDTLTSGIPVVPSGPQAEPGFPGPSAPQSRHTPPVLPDPPAPRGRHSGGDHGESDAYADEPTSAAPENARKGRNKLVLIGAGVVVLGGLAYGAGLLMNHSDVPKGTTVLGVDIGGGTRDEAVQKLDAAIAKRADLSLQLAVDGDKATLKPSQAGLTVDTQETVRQAAGSDYNPVSVIGSLFGAERVVDPVMPTDEEKLRDALERVAGTSGSAAEATIKFLPGKAVPSYGKSGKQLNPEGSVAAVEAAYRTQVETGSTEPVQLPVSAADPNVPKAEVDRMMKEFATPAMSGLITVRTDAAHTVSFSPEKSIYKFVSVVPSEDRTRLVPYYDREALKELYGGAFDDVQLTMADGSKKPVTPALVAQAVNRALVGKTPAERIVQIGPQQQN
ncbi:hypothetical protein RCO28_07350 [Streptomyces sp. LHD-70]|uniref:hypothetical protein n=1 Tax=Streptomyces sp. LHD-70 TaxID=3072140 RepID=UPI00280F276C|nr:hypothetical protein [Streptomyces sp. LHD-70]MDQ8702309.1 hypothetical protein [Streptomyces sp. LHD-70]